MPFLIAMTGALATGLIYWIRYGDGMAHIDQALRDWRTGRRRAASERAFGLAPLRALRHAADAAGVLMVLVARLRGELTPEQEARILARMETVTEPGDDLGTRMSVIRHAAAQAPDPDAALQTLAPLLRDRLTRTERDDLCEMLEDVAGVHQGPTDAQAAYIERIRRALHEAR